MITRLDSASARRISAGQVITDLTSVIKELLENALDAHAHTVKIRLVNFGLDEIRVEDDGAGIPVGPVLDTQTGKLAEGASTPLLCSRASTKHYDAAGERDGALYPATSPPSLRALTSQQEISSQHSSNNNSTDNRMAQGGSTTSMTLEDEGEDGRDPSLGFRGEALHSLAQVSELTVDTRTATTAPYTVHIAYDRAAHHSSLSVTRLRDDCGTTVTARRLFEHLPVRHREYKKNCRRQLTRATSTVKQYAVSHADIRLLMTHQESATSAVNTLVSLTGSGDASRSVTEAYGGLCVSHMQRVHWPLSFGEMIGFASKVDGGGRLSSDHQVFALDGRLVDLPRLAKAINDAFAQCLPNASQRLQVGFFLQIRTNASLQYDVNLTPDKRKVLLAQEERLAEEVYNAALQDFSLASQSIELNRDQRMAQTRAANLRATELTKLTRTPVSATSFTQFTFKRPKVEEKDPSTQEAAFLNGIAPADTTATSSSSPRAAVAAATMDLPKLGSFLYSDTALDGDSRDGKLSLNEEDASGSSEELPLLTTSSSLTSTSSHRSSSCASSRASSAQRDGNDQKSEQTTASTIAEEECSVTCGAPTEVVEVTRLSDEGCRPRSGGACHHCTFPELAELAKVDLFPQVTNEQEDAFESGATKRGRGAKAGTRTLGAQTDSDLTQYFSKNSFKEMRVIGQFNHGFIIAVLRNGDVFVVDQHASDEKANYERLMREYTATPQPLVIPVAVAMDAHEVNLAMEHHVALQQHGFKVQRGSDDTKLLVCSLPVLPYDVVSASDVVELIQQLVQYNTITRPLRAVWHSMATKACRSSIMIGTALTMKKMKQILERLGELDQPWNCPHGRPTLRLLGNLADLRRASGGGTAL